MIHLPIYSILPKTVAFGRIGNFAGSYGTSLLKIILTELVRLKKGPQSIGKSRGGLTTKIHSIVADVSLSIVRQLSSGSAADDPEGQELMEKVPQPIGKGKPLLMDKAYEGDECRAQAKKCGMRPVVPPKSNRIKPWRYDKSCISSVIS